MATSLALVATPHDDMTEASLNGYVMDFYITIREEDLDALDYSIIKLGSVCRKILDATCQGSIAIVHSHNPNVLASNLVFAMD